MGGLYLVIALYGTEMCVIEYKVKFCTQKGVIYSVIGHTFYKKIIIVHTDIF